MYLITGGTGFIGKNLVNELASKDEQIVIMSSFNNGSFLPIPNSNIKYEKGNITDATTLEAIFNKYDIDGVFHLAAMSDIRLSIEDPALTYKVNVAGTLNLLEAMRIHDVNKMVFASTAAVYGAQSSQPNREDMQPNPISPYAFTKLLGENCCNYYSAHYQMCISSLRYFNVYGPEMNSNSPAVVILKFIENIINAKPPLVFGNGTQTRDFVHINDVTQANIKAMSSARYGVYNVGTGIPTTLNTLADIIMNLTNVHLPITYLEERKGDIHDSVADITKAKEQLGYIPSNSLEKGIFDMLNLLKKNNG